MQNKHQLPDYGKAQALAVIKGYEAYKRDIEHEENYCKQLYVEAVDGALKEIFKDENPNFSLEVGNALMKSCIEGRRFSFACSGIDSISCSTFYRLRNRFLFLIVKKLEET